MLLDPETLDLAPRAAERAGRGSAATRASSSSCRPRRSRSSPRRIRTVAAAAAELARARATSPGRARRASAWPARARTRSRPAGARSTPARATRRSAPSTAAVARRQLVFGLHVHVAIRGADRALAVYNALRSYLPELAALAANAPFYEGRDTGLASVRPTHLATCCRARACRPCWTSSRRRAPRRCAGRVRRAAPVVVGAAPAPRLRHARGARAGHPDDRRTTRAAIAAVVHALATHLAAHHDAGEPLLGADSWRIDREPLVGLPARARRRAGRPRRPASAGRPASGWPPARRARLGVGEVGCERRRAARRARRWRRERRRCGRAGRVAGRSLRPRVGLRGVLALPEPRGAVTELLLAALDGSRRTPPAAPAAGRRRGPAARALPLLRAALPRPARRRRPLGVGAVAARAARRRSRPPSRRPLRARRARPGPAGREEMDVALREIDDADDGALAVAPPRARTARSSSSSSSSCTARPTSSRRPTRTRGRCRG